VAEAPFSPIVVYATMFGATEAVAERVAAALAAAFACEVAWHDVAWLDLKALEAHDPIVLGTSTWNVGQLPSDWEARIAELRALDLRGKRVAVFGTGDQRGYPETRSTTWRGLPSPRAPPWWAPGREPGTASPPRARPAATTWSAWRSTRTVSPS